MPWGVRFDAIGAFVNAILGYRVRRAQTYAAPFPQRTRFYNLLSRIGPVRNRLAPGLVHIAAAPGD